MKRKKRWLSFLMAIVMVMSSFLDIGLITSHAAGVERPDVKLTGLKILKENGQEFTESDKVQTWTKVRIDMEWDATSYGNQLKTGDYFIVDIPEQFEINGQPTNLNFPLYAPDGVTVMANAEVTKASSGGKIKVIFTDYVENKYNIKGRMHLISTFSESHVTLGEVNTFKVSIGVSFQTFDLKLEKPGKITHMLSKWTNRELSPDGTITWAIRMNPGQFPNHQNAIIKDKLTDKSGQNLGLTYIKDSFVLQEFEWQDTPQGWKPKEKSRKKIPESDITFSEGDTAFEYHVGDLSGHFYHLVYRSTYKKGMKPHNDVILKTDEPGTYTSHADFLTFEGGGEGSGDLKGKIQIIKVDAEDTNIKLKGATFKVTKLKDNSTFNLTTGEDGTILSDKLEVGKYKVEEITPPAGYKLDSTPQEVQVESDKATSLTFKNTPIKRDIKVTKKWDGKAAPSVEVVLKADGTEKSKQVITAPSWEYTFTNLRQYKPDGTEIRYTVDETPLAGYEKTISGDMTAGFEITNKNVSTVSINVEKKWIGKAGASATIVLKADGAIKTKHTLNAEPWKHTFADLPKYNGSQEIQYTVEEEPINGYKSVVSGDMNTGFVVKNYELVTIPVEKRWFGGKESEVTVQLKKDDVVQQILALNDTNNWRGQFSDLQVQNEVTGQPFKYEINEISVPGYATTIKKDGGNGYVITNVKTISIPVEKKWIGGEAGYVRLNLNGNGIKIQSLQLDSSMSWKGIFEDVPMYDLDGNLVKYTVTEDPVEGFEEKVEANDPSDVSRGFTVTNAKVKTISVEKKWLGEKQDKVIVRLYANGAEVNQKELNEKNKWRVVFDNLQELDSFGKTIKYSISEDPVPGYVLKQSGNEETGFVLTNIQTVNIPVRKEWIGEKGTMAQVYLKSDGTLVDFLVLNESNGWEAFFSNRPMYKENGEIINYELEEKPIHGYTSEILPIDPTNISEGFIVRNTQAGEPLKKSIFVEKQWIGPEKNSITVRLFGDGKELEVRELNAAMGWKAVFDLLPAMNADGSEIIYSISEDEIEGYSTSIRERSAGNFVIENRNEEKINIPVEKKWIGEAATEVELLLNANGVFTGRKLKLTAESAWQGMFTDVPMYDENGIKNRYEVEETSISGYVATVVAKDLEDASKGYVITNKKTEEPTPQPKLIDFEVSKEWMGISSSEAPEVRLFLVKNGEMTGEYVDLNEANGWRGLFEGLAFEDAVTGEQNRYEVKEAGEEAGEVELDGVRYRVHYDGGKVINEKVIIDPPPVDPPVDPPIDPPVDPPTNPGPEDPTPIEPQEPWQPDPQQPPTPENPEDPGIGGGDPEDPGIGGGDPEDPGIGGADKPDPQKPNDPAQPPTPENPENPGIGGTDGSDPQKPGDPQQPSTPENPGDLVIVDGDNPSDPTNPSGETTPTPPDAEVEIADGTVPKGTGDNNDGPKDSELEIADDATPKGSGDGSKLPKTGQASEMGLIGLFMILSGLTVLFFRKRRVFR